MQTVYVPLTKEALIQKGDLYLMSLDGHILGHVTKNEKCMVTKLGEFEKHIKDAYIEGGKQTSNLLKALPVPDGSPIYDSSDDYFNSNYFNSNKHL